MTDSNRQEKVSYLSKRERKRNAEKENLPSEMF